MPLAAAVNWTNAEKSAQPTRCQLELEMSRAHFYFALFLYDHSRNRISSSSDRNWQSICRLHFLLFLFGGSPVVFSCCCPPLFQPLLLKIVVMANHHRHHHHHHRSCGGGGDHRGESIALAKRSIESSTQWAQMLLQHCIFHFCQC